MRVRRHIAIKVFRSPESATSQVFRWPPARRHSADVREGGKDLRQEPLRHEVRWAIVKESEDLATAAYQTG